MVRVRSRIITNMIFVFSISIPTNIYDHVVQQLGIQSVQTTSVSQEISILSNSVFCIDGYYCPYIRSVSDITILCPDVMGY